MIGAIASAATTAVQAGFGIAQTVKGLTMPKPDIPDYNIPQELYQNMTDAEYWSFIGLPEAQKTQFIENSMRAGASALSASASRKGGLGIVSSVAQQQQDANKDLLSADVQARMNNLQNLWSARESIAGAKNIKHQADTAKAVTLREERQEMIGAGIQNIGGAAGTFGSLASEGAFDSFLKKKV